MSAVVSTLSEFVRDPKDVFLFLLFATIAFLFVRWVADRFNSGWGKRLLTEFEVLSKLETAEFEKTEKGKQAVSKLKDHISEVVIRKTTIRDRLQSVAEAFQFSLVGLVAILVLSFWNIYSGMLRSADDAAVLLVAITAVVVLSLLLDLMRIIVKVKIAPWIWLRYSIVRWRFRLRDMKKLQRRVQKLWESMEKGIEALEVLGEHFGHRPYPEYDRLIKEQLVVAGNHRETLEHALTMLEDYSRRVSQLLSDTKGKHAAASVKRIADEISAIRATYIKQLGELEEKERALKEILRIRPNVFFALP